VSEDPKQPEARRLEALWAGDFGDDYVDRNTDFSHREPFWNAIVARTSCSSVLEVGCNIGGNLEWLSRHIPATSVYGIDINRKALEVLHRRVPGVNALSGPARDLPFRDRLFDLVFTMGVLIHQPDATLPLVMSEMVRCSRRWLLCGEYFADESTPIVYRGHEGALFKRDYGALFAELFPELVPRDSGFLGRADGWDDVTWWLFERTD
jgi:spore coat polysaccharide biosynthesis protein SpsF